MRGKIPEPVCFFCLRMAGANLFDATKGLNYLLQLASPVLLSQNPVLSAILYAIVI